jgi:hypothetical protein
MPVVEKRLNKNKILYLMFLTRYTRPATQRIINTKYTDASNIVVTRYMNSVCGAVLIKATY